MKINYKIVNLNAFSGLRGFACLCVMIYHLSDPPIVKYHTFLKQISFLRNLVFIEYGYRWVTFFFVLSGFVLTQKYLVGVGKNYLRNRVFRIFPLHWLLIVLYTIKRPQDLNRFSDESLYYQLLLIQSWFKDLRLSWNFPAWTLSVEWFLYLLFFLVLLLFKKLKPNLNTLFLVILSGAGLLTFSGYYFGGFSVYLKNDVRDFLLGCCLALIIKNKILIKLFSSKILFLFSLIINYSLFYFKMFEYLSISFVFIIGATYYNQEWIRNFKLSRFLGLIGLISFPLYMIHIYLIETIGSALIPLGPFFGLGIYFVVLFLFGLLIHQLFEKKLYEFLKKV